MGLSELPYILVGLIVQSYKWAEFKIFQLFKTRVERRILHTYAPLGIVFEVDSDKNNNSSKQEQSSTNKKVAIDENHVKKKSEFPEGPIIKVKVHDKIFFTRLANYASMGLGESYMDGQWDCDNMIELFRRMFRKKVFLQYLNPWNRFLNYVHLSFFNLQTEKKCWEVGRKHYDLGNDLFKSFLDPWLTYSCGYWAKASNLDEAQIHKMDLIAKKLQLKPGMRVLDIGCGWGGLCKYLAKNYGVSCVGITISKEGANFARESCSGLPVEIRLEDYRDLDEKFDRIVSVGMFEHVGVHNYREFFEVASRCLVDDGLFLLHTIGISHKYMPRIEPWFHTYIFPNGCLPYYKDVTEKTEGLFILEDWHSFGTDYSKTLQAWLQNFKKNWPKLQDKYGERFYRMWTYYLQSSAGGFDARQVQLWQVVLSKQGIEGGYRAAR